MPSDLLCRECKEDQGHVKDSKGLVGKVESFVGCVKSNRDCDGEGFLE